MNRPLIGITTDTVAGHTAEQYKYESSFRYSRVVSEVGGLPILLPYEVEHIPEYLEVCDGMLMTGGDDPDLSIFNQPTHPKAKLMHARRQTFETSMLLALDETTHPVLGICLGMQMMALNAGGRLHQHLPDAEGFTEDRAAAHQEKMHPIDIVAYGHPVLKEGGEGHSRHHQAVANPGDMRVVAMHDDVIEAIDRPGDRFYLGVQWHPECTPTPTLGADVIAAFVLASDRWRNENRTRSH